MLRLAELILIFPIVSFLAITFLTRKSEKLSSAVSISAIFLSLVSSLLIFFSLSQAPGSFEFKMPWFATISGFSVELGFLVNPLSSVMLLVVTGVSFLVQVYSLGYMKGDEGYTKYYSFISLFSFSMLGLVLANNLLQMYIFWELVGLCSYLLIGHWYSKPSAANAAKKAFIVTRFGDFGFLVAIILISFKTGTFNFLQIEQLIKAGALSQQLVTVVALLLFAGAAGKSAQFPLHIWLPDAMEGPTPVSALIHAATMVAAGVYLVARTYYLFVFSGTALEVIAVIGAFTAFFAGSIALVQNDIKRVLAYSTVSQLGYMMLGLGVGGFTAGYFHLITHASFKALLFLGAGSVIHAMHTNDIWEMGGLFKKMKVTALTFLVGSLALSGLFPTSGFFSKDAILIQAYHSGHTALFVMGLLTAAFTAFYMARVFFVVFLSKERSAGGHPHESPAVMTVPLVLLALFALGLGYYTGPFGSFVLGSEAGGEHHGLLIPLVSNALALLSMLAAWAIYHKELISSDALAARFSWPYKILKNKYYVDEFYAFCVNRILFNVSRLANWFDRNIVDGSVDGVFRLTRFTAVVLRGLQTGLVQNYALGIVGGMVAVWILLRILR